jgi:hypothetical protein
MISVPIAMIDSKVYDAVVAQPAEKDIQPLDEVAKDTAKDAEVVDGAIPSNIEDIK